MIIELPEVNMYASKIAFNSFMEQFNDSKEHNREMLKSPHLQMFDKLIQLSNRQIKKDRQSLVETEPSCLHLNTEEPYVLFTNSTSLSRILKCSANTVRNRIAKLEKSGAIVSKTNHGRTKNYELLLNPELLLINDVDNPLLLSKSQYIEINANTHFISGKTQNLVQALKEINYKPNKIMNVSGVEKSDTNESSTAQNLANGLSNYLKYSRTSNRIKNKHHKLAQENLSIPNNLEEKRKKVPAKKEKSPAEIRAEKLQAYKNRIATWLVAYAIGIIWKNKDIVEPEYIRTVHYIEQEYLKNANYQQCQEFQKQAKWRIDAVGRYIERKKYNMTQYPFQYFHKTNRTSGFVITKKWYDDAKSYWAIKQEQKTKRTDWHKLQDAIRRYTKDRTMANFKKEEHYVKDNIPEYYNEFLQHFSQNQYN